MKNLPRPSGRGTLSGQLRSRVKPWPSAGAARPHIKHGSSIMPAAACSEITNGTLASAATLWYDLMREICGRTREWLTGAGWRLAMTRRHLEQQRWSSELVLTASLAPAVCWSRRSVRRRSTHIDSRAIVYYIHGEDGIAESSSDLQDLSYSNALLGPYPTITNNGQILLAVLPCNLEVSSKRGSFAPTKFYLNKYNLLDSIRVHSGTPTLVDSTF